MSKARKTIAIALAAAMSMGLCASAYADMSTTVTDNAVLSTLEETSAQPGETPTEAPSLPGTVNGSLRADIPAGDEGAEIPIENSSGMIGVDVQITKGGEYIESVTVKNGSLVVKVRSSGTLTEDQEYSVDVTLYDMGTGKRSNFTVTGVIEAPASSSKPDDSGSKPDDSSSKPNDDNSSSSSSQPEQITKIGLKDAVDGVVTASLYKYGGDDEVEIPILIPEGAGTIRLKDKDIVEGRDVIRKVSVSGRKLVVEAKFPYDMLDEPEDYEIEVTLEDSKSKETAVFTIKGTVYWQESDAPVSPDEYREKKYVVVDFDGNDGEDIDFQNGSIRTDGLKSGVVNLDVSYSGTSVDCDGLDLYTVNFLAAPRLDRSVTVCLDADEGNCVYQVSNGGKLTKLDATYNKSAGELRFETRKLGEYVVTEKEVKQEDSEKKTDSTSSAADTKKDTASKENIPTATEKNPGTGAYGEGGKTVPNTGRFEKPNPNTGAYPLF